MSSLPTRGVRYLARRTSAAAYRALLAIPYFHFIRNTQNTQTPCTFRMWFVQKVLRVNAHAYWPMHFTSKVSAPKNVYAGIDVSPGYEGGCYIQAIAPVHIGDYTQIARNVGIISANHDVYDLRNHVAAPVNIGRYCWIGMNSVILPGVTLGDFTIVGAGSVVTKSFSDGYCIIAGNPAVIIRPLDRSKCVPYRNEFEYFGYIRAENFDAFKRRFLNV